MEDAQEDRSVPGREHDGVAAGGPAEEHADEVLQHGHGPGVGEAGASTSASHMMDIVRRRREAEEKLAQHLFAVEPQLRRTE